MERRNAAVVIWLTRLKSIQERVVRFQPCRSKYKKMTNKKNSSEKVIKKRGGQKGHPPPKTAFKKGHDPKRNIHGQRSAASVAFFKQLRELIVTEGEKIEEGKNESGKFVKHKKVEWMIKVLWQEAIAGKAWAIEFITEKVEGKIVQPISGEIKVPLKLIIERNGNSNDSGKRDNASGSPSKSDR